MKLFARSSSFTRDRPATARADLRPGVKVAIAGYGVVVGFGVAYGITRSRWPDIGQASAAIVAVLAVAPLALALLWDRIASVKAFGFEISLSTVSTRTDIGFVEAITKHQYFSTREALVEQITQAIIRPEQELLEVNLRGGDYWWSTRLYLVAALADDYSRIQQLVVTEEGPAREFVGMAAPGHIRQAMAREWPTLEIAYQSIKTARPGSLSSSEAGTSEQAWLVKQFVAHTFEQEGRPAAEVAIVVKVDATRLHDWMMATGRRLSVDSVDWTGVSSADLVRSLLLQFDGPYVALLRQGRLDRVVNRLDLAVRVGQRAQK